MQGVITALNQIGARLQQEVKGAAASAVTAALKDLHQGIQEAASTSVQMRKYSLWRGALQQFMVALAAITVTLLAVAWYVPTPSEMNQLRAERDQLQASIEDLGKRGAKVKMINCGSTKRLCVLVDQAAGTFGVAGNKDDVYMIAKGY